MKYVIMMKLMLSKVGYLHAWLLVDQFLNGYLHGLVIAWTGKYVDMIKLILSKVGYLHSWLLVDQFLNG